MALTNLPPLSSFNDLRTCLLVFESKHTMYQAAASSPFAFYSTRNSVGGSSNGRDGQSFRHNGVSGYNQAPRNNGGGRSNQHGGSRRYGQRRAVQQQRHGILEPAPVNRGPLCWACNHIGALCPQSTRSDDDTSCAFAGMHISSSYPTWYPDTDGTHHMTSDARSMT